SSDVCSSDLPPTGTNAGKALTLPTDGLTNYFTNFNLMTGEFNSYCSQYYTLTQLLIKQNDYLKTHLAKAPTYNGQTSVNEIDDILKHYRKIHRAKTGID